MRRLANMATDDERREVAARLRSLEVPSRVERKERTEKAAAWYELICGAVGGKKDPWFGIKALADRLADLIDPDCEEGRYDGLRTVRPVDREALLALADEMERRAPYALHGGWRDSLRDYARRIREALGVQDA